MQIAPLSDALGVELKDFDITRPRTPDEQAELRELFCEHHLLAVRGQTPTALDQDRFMAYFGPLQVMPNGTRAEYVTNRDDPLAGAAGTARLLFHSDGAYGPRPGLATSLWAEDASPSAPPTLFASGTRVLNRLPAELRAQVERLHAVHIVDRGARAAGNDTYERILEADVPVDAAPGRFRRHEHPIALQLPHSGRKTVFVSEHLTSHVVELPPDEGEALLQDLFARLYADDNVYAHYWRTNDVIVWDNIALQHARPAEIGSAPRHLRRLSLDGWNTERGVLDWRAPSFAD